MTQSFLPAESMECPLCLGEGHLKRAEVLERLGAKDFARVAQLSAEEAFRLLLQKHKQDEQIVWARFESELAKRLTVAAERHREELRAVQTEKTAIQLRLQTTEKLADQQKAVDIQRVRIELESKLHSEQSQREDLNRRVEDYFREVKELRERNQQLETEMAKVARIGKREEVDFAEEARTWPGVYVSEKLTKNGDYILAYRDPSGAPLVPQIVVDNKDKAVIAETDIKKIVRDAKERRSPVGIIVAKDETQLQQIDRECRWAQEDGVWLLRTTRHWLPRDLEVLKPVFERMRTDGPDFLHKNTALAEEVRRTFIDFDVMGKELGKAAKAIQSVSGLVAKYRERLQVLCDGASRPKMMFAGENIGGHLEACSALVRP